MDTTKSVSVGNILSSPGTTILGAGLAVQAIGQGLVAGGVPTNATGWLQLFLGALAVFLR